MTGGSLSQFYYKGVNEGIEKGIEKALIRRSKNIKK